MRRRGLPLVLATAGAFVLAALAGCGGDDGFSPCGPSPSRVRILTLGDSYTVGEGIDPRQAWPFQLADSLAARGDTLAVEMLATTGWRTDDLLAGLRREVPEGPFAAVMLMIGVNDQYQGFSVEHYAAYLDTLLVEAADLVEGPDRLLVFSIPDYGVTPVGGLFGGDAVSAAIDTFNLRGRTLAVGRSHRWLDVTQRSREAGGDPSLVARDGLHFSAAMYALWVGDMLPVVTPLVGAPRPAGRKPATTTTKAKIGERTARRMETN